MAITNKLRIGILGASGYTGAELLRLLARHPGVEIRAADRRSPGGQADRGDLSPSRRPRPADAGEDRRCRLVERRSRLLLPAPWHDAGGDRRLAARVSRSSISRPISASPISASYAQWYGHEHRAPDLQKEAVYGLTELARAAVAGARLVANPGCYPTSAQLPLMPLLEAGLIDAERHHHRCQIRRDRRRPRRQAAEPLCRGDRGHPRLWHRQPSPRAGDRAGAERRRRASR